MLRVDGRAPDQLRPAKITPGTLVFPEGSALIEMGLTKVICAVTVEERVPAFLRGAGRGWVTAEYGMLPRSTSTRIPREGVQLRQTGRTQEIQRIIGRSLRAVVDLATLGERTFLVDCDVLQADGGTRTAAITAAYVALYQACIKLLKEEALDSMPFKRAVAAVSVGLVDGQPLLDLCYEEDSKAETDFNVVMTDWGEFVEVQGTAESDPFTKDSMASILRLAEKGIGELLNIQNEAINKIKS